MSKCPANLWRAVHTGEFPNGPIRDGEPAPGVLYPTFERKAIGTLPNGKTKYREPDVRVDDDGMVQAGGGTSLYDRDAFFRGRSWRYMLIPKNTEVDPNLVITGPERNDFFDANHYQIEAAKPMFLATFKGALDNLARSAVKKAYEDARR